MDFHPYQGRSGWLKELERLITDLRRDHVPPGRISVLLLRTPRGDEEKHLERMGLRRLSEDDVSHLGSASLQNVTWSIVSGFKGLENDVVIVAGLTDIETDWHRGGAQREALKLEGSELDARGRIEFLDVSRDLAADRAGLLEELRVALNG